MDVERATARVTSLVLFVAGLDRSVAFYRDVFSCTLSVQGVGAALLLAPDGFQLYLIERGSRAEHPLGGIGPQYLIWAVDSEAELRDMAQVLRDQMGQAHSYASGGVSFVAARDPDGIRILVAHPRPESLPRSVVDVHLYA